MIAGLVAGYCLFDSARPEQAADGLRRGEGGLFSDREGESKLARGAMPHAMRMRSGKGDDPIDLEPAEQGGVMVDWDKGHANLPLHYLEQLDLTAFTSEDQSPWIVDGDTDAFVISPELNEILQLDASQRDAVRAVLLDAWESHVAARWAAPAAISGDGRAVVIEIAPAAAEVEDSIVASLRSIMGEKRARFFLSKIQSTLDWEYGGFGSSRRRVEVSILPDDTISIRESLRHAPGSGGSTGNNQGFELEARQRRVDQLPPSIAALMSVEE